MKKFAETDYRTMPNLAKRLCCTRFNLLCIGNIQLKAGICSRDETHQALINLVDELNIIENRPNFTIGEVRDAFYKYIKSEHICDIRYIKYLYKKYGIGDGKI